MFSCKEICAVYTQFGDEPKPVGRDFFTLSRRRGSFFFSGGGVTRFQPVSSAGCNDCKL